MNLRTLMQAAPARANELFSRLSETSDGAVKTRERLFAELKAELELHTSLEEQHLFPILRKNAEKELVSEAIRENRELQARIDELAALPKNDEGFLDKLKDLQKAFRQHARDDKTEILPAVQRALSEEQVQTVTERMEAGRAEAEQAKQDEAEERRAKARQERELADQQAQQAEAAEGLAREVAGQARQATRQMADAGFKSAEIAADTTRQATNAVAETANAVARTTTEMVERAPAPRIMPFAEMFLWPWMGAMQASNAAGNVAAPRAPAGAQEVIPLGEEVLEVGKRTVSRGTARIHRYVVETPAEQQVTLQSERVVIERRRPTGERPNGEILTEVTIEMAETDEVAVVGKRQRLREEIVVRTERTAHVETVRETLRHDEVEIQQPGKRRTQQLRTVEN
jgi:uncharacterized protein (TIGR02271 family)